MPVFEFRCQDCSHMFTVMIPNRDKSGVKCSKCGSKNIKQVFTSFGTIRNQQASTGTAKRCGG